jgi:5-methylcytosine-specific restriction endonuclease McrA
MGKATCQRAKYHRKIVRRQVLLGTRWRAQNQGRCIWCGEQTWLKSEMKPTAAANLLIMSDNLQVDPSDEFLGRRTATTEHIIPSGCGGENFKSNIACACHGCNNARGDRLTGWKPQPELLRLLPMKVKASFDLLAMIGEDELDGIY